MKHLNSQNATQKHMIKSHNFNRFFFTNAGTICQAFGFQAFTTWAGECLEDFGKEHELLT